MNVKLLERRQETLKLKGKGYPLNSIVKDLSVKYGVSKSAIYEDWRRRIKWMPILLNMENMETAFLDIQSRHEEIYSMTVLEYMQADNSNAKIGALRLLRDLNRDVVELFRLPELTARLKALEKKAESGVFINDVE